MSYLYLPELAEAYSQESCSDGAAYVPSRSTPTASGSSSSGSGTESSRSSPSGTTSAPSPGASGAVESTSLPPGFLASLSPQQAREDTIRIRTCGPNASWPFAILDLDTCSWRTPRELFPRGTWDEFCGTWPASGLMRDGVCCQREPLERITSEPDGGWLATPTATANQLAPSMMKWPCCRRMLPTPVARGRGR